MDVVRKIEQSKPGAQDRPEKDIVIIKSGHIPVEKIFSVENGDATE